MSDLRAPLRRLVIEAFELALERLASGDHRPFIFFADERGRKALIDVEAASGRIDEKLVAEAREIVAKGIGKAKRYALAFDGLLTSGKEKIDAVLLEAGEQGEPEALLVAQPYGVQKKALTTLGDPVLLGPVKQLLKADKKHGVKSDGRKGGTSAKRTLGATKTAARKASTKKPARRTR
ncbi:MAG TPA: hypothetical protein VGK32_22935 [Vicinamibacterales bacterium]|jgi:hypothetical protein